MSAKFPAVGELWDDRDSRMNRRVRVVAIVDPKDVPGRSSVVPYAIVENVGGSRALTARDQAFLSPVGKRSTVKVSAMVSRFRLVSEPEEPTS